MEGQAVLSQNLLEVLDSVNDLKRRMVKLEAETEEQKKVLAQIDVLHQELREKVSMHDIPGMIDDLSEVRTHVEKLHAQHDEHKTLLKACYVSHSEVKDELLRDRAINKEAVNLSEVNVQ